MEQNANIVRHIEFLKQMIFKSSLILKIKGERFKRFRLNNSPVSEVHI